ncbi:MAG: phosphohistidine phosphatase SixA [Abitibacteriaceae bacterium]|nr:phosphohistidine phosphatase SixA [Abditibacteriaceae bacterium]
MRLLLMRHGIAAPVGGKVKDDASRPLTPEGQDKTRQAASGLKAYDEPPNLIATSPLRRAEEAAQIVLEVYRQQAGSPRMETWPELEHAEPAALMQRLQTASQHATILLVGHEPGLSRFVAYLLTGSPTGLTVEFKKAAVCALDVEIYGAPQATLLWHATPRQLRLMAERRERE